MSAVISHMPKNSISRIDSNGGDGDGAHPPGGGTNAPGSPGVSPTAGAESISRGLDVDHAGSNAILEEQRAEEIPLPLWRQVILQYLRRYPEFSPPSILVDELEDVAQEIIARLLKTLQRRGVNIGTDDPSSLTLPGPYIQIAARNTVSDYFRWRSRELRFTHVPLPESDDDDERDADEFVTHSHDKLFRDPNIPHELVEEMIAELFDAMLSVSERSSDPNRTMRVMELAALDYSYAEIAERLGVTENVIRNTLSRVRKRLAKEHPEWATGRRLRGPQRGSGRKSRAASSNGDEQGYARPEKRDGA